MKTFLTALILICGIASTASAQQGQCDTFDVMTGFLKEKHGEEVVLSGVDMNGYAVDITMDADGNWSLLLTNPETGLTCMIVVGTGGALRAKPIGGKDS